MHKIHVALCIKKFEMSEYETYIAGMSKVLWAEEETQLPLLYCKNVKKPTPAENFILISHSARRPSTALVMVCSNLTGDLCVCIFLVWPEKMLNKYDHQETYTDRYNN